MVPGFLKKFALLLLTTVLVNAFVVPEPNIISVKELKRCLHVFDKLSQTCIEEIIDTV